MLEFLLKGLSYGVVLSFLVGPIVFTLLQASLERGIKIALSVGLGVWISDFLFIATVFFGLSSISEISTLPNFKFFLGSVGSVVLIAFGIGTLLNNKPVDKNQKVKENGYFAHFIKGFLINTINPFSVFFWLAMSTEIITNNANNQQAVVFFGAILSVIILTDLLKVVLAKQVSKYLTPKHIIMFRKIVGSVLIIFGIILIYRVGF
ncbi:MAG: LysE family translocator [Saprospiraceae bacterium]